MATWIRHHKANPCPICNSAHKDCRTNATTGIAYCRAGLDNCPPGDWRFLDYDPHGAAKFCPAHRYEKLTGKGRGKRKAPPPEVAEGWRLPQGPPPAPDVMTDPKATARIFREVMKRPREMTGERLAAFMLSMNLPAEAGYNLAAVGTLYDVELWGRHWLGYLMRDGAGIVTGMKLRDLDGNKQTLGFVGIAYNEETLRNSTGPIFVVEGGSDALTLAYLGLPVIARDNNTGGGPEAAALLDRLGLDPTRLIIMGENDRHKSKAGAEIWPGRDGALKVARDVADALGVPVRVGMPPADIKDPRHWFGAEWVEQAPADLRGLAVDDLFSVEAAARPAWARAWLGLVLPTAIAVEPTPPPTPEPYPEGFAATGPVGGNPYAGEFRGLDLGPREAPTLPVSYRRRACDCPNRPDLLFQIGVADSLDSLILSPPCGKISCHVCGPLLREYWVESGQFHMRMREYRTRQTSLYIFHVRYASAKWRQIRKALYAAGACWVGLRRIDCPADFVTSTVPPPANLTDCQRVTTDAAIDRLAAEAALVPPQYVHRAYFSSQAGKKGSKRYNPDRDWTLLNRPEPREQPRYRLLAKINATLETARGIIDARGLGRKPIRGTHPYFPYQGDAFRLTEALPASHLAWEIGEGEILPIVQISFKVKGSDGAALDRLGGEPGQADGLDPGGPQFRNTA